MLKNGTTVVEAKSGYGLEPETEMKMLRVLKKAMSLQPIDISTTYCGAHSVLTELMPGAEGQYS
jgi:imidazolonepropionase